jgi:hypothetical protein
MQLIAPYDNSCSESFLCLSISAKTNRLFFTIGGPDGVRGRFALFKPTTRISTPNLQIFLKF